MRYFWIFLLCLSPVWAHQSLLTESGNHVKWTRSQVPLVLKLENSNQESTTALKNVIENSISEWNRYSEVKIIQTNSDSNGNSLSFVKNFPYGRGVLGVTEVKHSAPGVIESAKIFINDDHFFSTSTGTYNTFLGDVVTHELGHMLGLSHSEVLDSTMFYTSFPGHHTLASDDIAGVRGKYDAHHYGKISGVIQGGKGVGILGAHVQAISRTTGKSVGAISKEDGTFEIDGLDLNETYFLYTSPLKKLSSLPGYYANSQSKFCPASYVGSFFSKCGQENEGIPQGIGLTENNPETNVGVVTINCDYRTPFLYKQSKPDGLVVDFPELSSSSSASAMSGWFTLDSSIKMVESRPDKFHIDLTQVREELSGSSNLFLRIIALAHPLGSEMDLKLKIHPSLTGTPISGTNNILLDVPLFLSSSPFLEVEVTSYLSNQGYYSLFPIIEGARGKVSHPYLLVAGIVEKVGPQVRPYINTEAYLSDNSSCLDAPFAKSVEAVKVQVEKLEAKQEMGVPSCGTIDPPSGSGPGPSFFIMTLGFLLTLLISAGAKSSKKFLS